MSFKMTVITIFWIVVVTVILADLIYMLVNAHKNNAVAAKADTVNVPEVENREP